MGVAKKTDKEISTSNRAGVINGGTWMEHCSNQRDDKIEGEKDKKVYRNLL